jgi:hypothetical protein
MLGYRFFDKRVMERMSSEFGMSSSNVVDFSEEQYEVRSFLDRLRGPRVVAQVRTWREDLRGRREPVVQPMDERQAITLVRGAIRTAYEQDNIVIVGRGGQAILQDEPGVLHVRIVAPPEERIQRVQEQEGVSERDAERQITERDRTAADYVDNFYEVDWSDPMLYDLVINTGTWDTEAAARIIVNAVSQLPSGEATD